MTALNEKDKLQEMLTSEKELAKVYGTFITEASTTQLRELFKNNMFEVASDQFEVFNIMSERNYYKIKAASEMDIENAVSKYEKEKI